VTQKGWSAVHRQSWINSIRDHAAPVHLVDTALVLKVLKPLWTTKHVTASRLRTRIESALDWATAHHYRQGPNPAAWKNHLALILDKTTNIHLVESSITGRCPTRKSASSLPGSAIVMIEMRDASSC
jgi:hypothetical protein